MRMPYLRWPMVYVWMDLTLRFESYGRVNLLVFIWGSGELLEKKDGLVLLLLYRLIFLGDLYTGWIFYL
jgi:hypothetical protein